MAVTINGNGTITGISVGGLPDGIVDRDMIASSVNTITHVDCWRITTDFTDNQTPVSANLERAIDGNGSDGYGTIGDPMTVSSGVFTFPVTGIWRVEFSGFYANANPSATTNTVIKLTLNNGSDWDIVAQSVDSIGDDGSETVYSATYCSCILDINDLSNRKVRFDVSHEATTVTFKCNADKRINMTFTRLGDT